MNAFDPPIVEEQIGFRASADRQHLLPPDHPEVREERILHRDRGAGVLGVHVDAGLDVPHLGHTDRDDIAICKRTCRRDSLGVDPHDVILRQWLNRERASNSRHELSVVQRNGRVVQDDLVCVAAADHRRTFVQEYAASDVRPRDKNECCAVFVVPICLGRILIVRQRLDNHSVGVGRRRRPLDVPLGLGTGRHRKIGCGFIRRELRRPTNARRRPQRLGARRLLGLRLVRIVPTHLHRRLGPRRRG